MNKSVVYLFVSVFFLFNKLLSIGWGRILWILKSGRLIGLR